MLLSCAVGCAPYRNTIVLRALFSRKQYFYAYFLLYIVGTQPKNHTKNAHKPSKIKALRTKNLDFYDL